MKRLAARSCLLSASALVACNGELTVLSEPVDVSSSSGSNLATGNGLPQCPDLSVGYPSSFADFPQLIECGVCTCEAGEVACSERACRPFETIGRCPEHSENWADAQASRADIEGDTLFIDAKGYGGCGDVDFEACFVPPAASTVASQSEYPRFATIRILNPTLPEDCPKVAFQHFELGLRALSVAGFRSEEGGLILSTFGLIQAGDLTCRDGHDLASDQIHREILVRDPYSDGFVSCESDADCHPGFGVSCSDCVNLPSNAAAYADLAPELARIEAAVCAPLGDCSQALGPWTQLGCQGLRAVCRNGRCEGAPP